MNKLVCILILPLLLFSSCGKEEPVRMIFAGNLMLDRGVRKQIEKKGPEWILQWVGFLFQEADFAVANLECPVTSQSSPIHKKFVFRGEPEWLPALKNAGLSHLVMANNHSNDHGRDGMVSTAANLEHADLIPIGYGSDSREACAPVELIKGSRKIAIFSSVFLPLETWMPFPDKPGVCQADAGSLAEGIRKYRKNEPKALILVTLHWGVEYQRMPTRTQRMQARQLIEAGADGIIGHHPHVVQSIEWVEGKPVIYSLGNFVFDTKREEARRGIMLELNWGEEPEWTLYPYLMRDCRPEIMNKKERIAFWEELREMCGKNVGI